MLCSASVDFVVGVDVVGEVDEAYCADDCSFGCVAVDDDFEC